MNKGAQYLSCIENSERIFWTISEVLPENYILSYQHKFMPSSISQETDLSFLKKSDQFNLNQIWGASYLNIFGFVEEYITLFTLNLATESTFEENLKLRAYIRFSEEEIKHQMLFEKFIKKFNETFIIPCEFLSNSQEVASTILSNSKLSVLILTYHLEVLTQQHYLHSIKGNETLDSKFKEILHKHWLEEVQHAKIDLLKLQDEVEVSSNLEIQNSTLEYFNILDAFVSLLELQVDMNFNSLQKCGGDISVFQNTENRNEFKKKQLWSYIYCFLVLGMENRSFLDEIKKISTSMEEKIIIKAQEYRKKYQSGTSHE